MLLRIVTVAMMLLALVPAFAQTPDDAAANRLFVEAVQLWNRAREEPAGQQVATLEQVQSRLQIIIERHFRTPVGMRLFLNEVVGPLSLTRVQEAVVAARARAASEARAIAAANAANALGFGRVFRDCEECPEMVVVPPGIFLMGPAPGEEDAEKVPQQSGRQALRQREVQIAAFAVGRTEVTRAQYSAFAREMGHETGRHCWKTIGNGIYGTEQGRSWQSPGFAQNDNHPATCLSWTDAQTYLIWLSGKTGKSYRFLTEPEWEYAARAGTTTRHPWGDSAEDGCAHANLADATLRRVVAGMRNRPGTNCDDRHPYTAPVGSYQANAFGLFDMIGNVWEWTSECWREHRIGQTIYGTADCSGRILRGGSWHTDPRLARSASRHWNLTDHNDEGYGFRVARDF